MYIVSAKKETPARSRRSSKRTKSEGQQQSRRQSGTYRKANT